MQNKNLRFKLITAMVFSIAHTFASSNTTLKLLHRYIQQTTDALT